MKVNGANTETFSLPSHTKLGHFRAARTFLTAEARGPEIKKRFSGPLIHDGRDRDAINLLVALLIDQVQSCRIVRLAESHAIDDVNKPEQLRETEIRKFRN